VTPFINTHGYYFVTEDVNLLKRYLPGAESDIGCGELTSLTHIVIQTLACTQNTCLKDELQRERKITIFSKEFYCDETWCNHQVAFGDTRQPVASLAANET
jgi:hypothetical protein